MAIELKPCPCCGVEVNMEPTTGRYKGGYAFCHPGGKTSVKCVMQGGIIFSNFREAQEWADAWNRRKRYDKSRVNSMAESQMVGFGL